MSENLLDRIKKVRGLEHAETLEDGVELLLEVNDALVDEFRYQFKMVGVMVMRDLKSCHIEFTVGEDGFIFPNEKEKNRAHRRAVFGGYKDWLFENTEDLVKIEGVVN